MKAAELRRFEANAARAVYVRIRDLAVSASARGQHTLAVMFGKAAHKAWNRYLRLSRRPG